MITQSLINIDDHRYTQPVQFAIGVNTLRKYYFVIVGVVLGWWVFRIMDFIGQFMRDH